MDLLGGVFTVVTALLVLTGIILGLVIAMFMIHRHSPPQQIDATAQGANSSSSSPRDIETQLDRIETAVNRTRISSNRIAAIAVGLAAVIFASQGLEIALEHKIAVFAGGVTAIICSRFVR